MRLMVEFPALSLVAIREWKEKRRGQQRVERGQVEKGQQSDKTGSKEKRERCLLVITSVSYWNSWLCCRWGIKGLWEGASWNAEEKEWPKEGEGANNKVKESGEYVGRRGASLLWGMESGVKRGERGSWCLRWVWIEGPHVLFNVKWITPDLTQAFNWYNHQLDGWIGQRLF